MPRMSLAHRSARRETRAPVPRSAGAALGRRPTDSGAVRPPLSREDLAAFERQARQLARARTPAAPTSGRVPGGRRLPPGTLPAARPAAPITARARGKGSTMADRLPEDVLAELDAEQQAGGRRSTPAEA